LAPRLAGQLIHGGETINHYAVSDPLVMGAVSRDHLGQGIVPCYLPEQNIWGVLQGELYDCAVLEWRKTFHESVSDLEIFARLYREGVLAQRLPVLNGAFFVALWDPEKETLVCANDRYGLYPMYWSQGNERFCIADRVLCSVLAGTVPGHWDLSGVACLLTTDDFVGQSTLVEGVETFPPATIMTKTGDLVRLGRYWDYDFTSGEESESLDEMAEELGNRFTRAVERQCKAGRSIGVTLSGGLDSRMIVAAASKADIPIQTFTWGKPESYDRKIANTVAATFGAKHHDCEYAHSQLAERFEEGTRMTEGLVNYFDCHMLAHLQHMDGAADIILNGYAGDVILGGSFLRESWMNSLHLGELSNLIFSWRNTLLAEKDLGLAIPEGINPTEETLPSNRYRSLMSPLAAMDTPDLVDRFILENRQRRLTAMGTVIMRSVVESSACFFDYDLMDLELAVPARQRLEHRMYKRVLKCAFPETLSLRWQRTLLPAGAPEWQATPSKAMLKGCRILEKLIGWPHVASRQSPVDFAGWLRGPLKPWMAAICSDAHPVADEVLLPEFCRSMWHEHLDGRDRSRYLGVIASIRGFSRALEQARKGNQAVPCKPVQVEK
jgi:asparagine synthase (glutamine-hydrolysing)